MAKGMNQPPDQLINGSFGELTAALLNNSGVSGAMPVLFLGEVQQIQAKITKEKKEVILSGSRKKRYKLMSVAGEGTLKRFKVNSDFLRVVGNVFHPREGTDVSVNPAGNNLTSITVGSVEGLSNQHHNIDFRTSMLITLDDPEAVGVEQVRLLNVKFWEIPLGWSVNELVEEEISFTFEDFEFVTAIGQTRINEGYSSFYDARYAAQRNA